MVDVGYVVLKCSIYLPLLKQIFKSMSRRVQRINIVGRFVALPSLSLVRLGDVSYRFSHGGRTRTGTLRIQYALSVTRFIRRLSEI